MGLKEMLELGRDRISTSIHSTPNHKSTIQNYAVSLKAKSQHFATANDDNLRLAFMPYFGVIEENWELNCVKFTVCVFRTSQTGVCVQDPCDERW